MSAPLIVPFNYQPNQVIVNNTSYTVPGGHYARVSVISQVGWVILNGTAISTNSHSASTLMSASGLTDFYITYYTVPQTRLYLSAYASIFRTDPSSGTATYYVRVLASDNTTVRFEQVIGGIANGSTATFDNVGLNPGDQVQYYVTNINYNQANIFLYLNAASTTLAPFDLWLKAGDNIAISSGAGSFTVQLYKAVT